jgi:hypothetical protein
MGSQLDLNKFNSFIESASQQIACGKECQKQKKAEQLKTNYLNAQANLSLAGPQYEVAKKDYYTYVDGQSGYNQMMEDEYTSKSQLIVQTFNNNYNDEISKIKSMLETYDGILINLINVVDLYKQYKTENAELFLKLKNETNDVLTNERKTYYEDQNIDSLNKYYYYILLIIYIITVICFAIFSLFYPSQSSWKIKGSLFLLFLVLPFISTFLLGKIIQFVYWIFGLLPKNVYL